MAFDSGATAFVTDAAGFIGMELVKVLVASNHQVFGLVQSVDDARRLRQAGATAVIGNLLEPGQWQDEAAADWVFHLGASPLGEHRLTRRRARSIGRARVSADAHLLDAVAQGATRRIVYMADAMCYGAVGTRPVTEDEPPRPSAWGHSLETALERVEGYALAGLPIVTALPAWVYGNGSWLRERVIGPVMTGRPVLQFGSTGPWVSPIHVHDCARALLHLAEHVEHGQRYFLADAHPVRLHEFAEVFASLAGRPLRVRRMPAVASALVAGVALADCLISDAVFSNIRLRGTGFRSRYPTIEQGLREVVGGLK